MDEKQLESKYSSGVYTPLDIQLVRGEGTRVWDSEGKEYIDCAGGIGVANVGHSNPKVAEALAKQASTLTICPASYYYNDKRAQLLEKLSQLPPSGLTKAFLCNSGTEAVEGALKFARAHTGNTEVIAAMRAFHGRTMGSLSATWKRKYRKPFQPLVPQVNHVPYGNIDKMKEAVSEETAAVLLEPIQGEGGIHLPPENYLSEVRDLCTASETILILDEVQTGFGRTGHMFACQHWQVEPDIMCVAKSMGGGIPIGAIRMKDEIDLHPGIHGSTFGGNPLSSAAALAAITYMEENELPEVAAETGKYFLTRLKRLSENHPKTVREARGLGLMLALQLREKSGPYLNKLLNREVLALPAGSNVIRFLPPLEISSEDIDQVINCMNDIFDKGEKN